MYDYIQTPIAEMREEPSLSSKIVSQALFAEEIGKGAVVGGWVRIITTDHYMGWVDKEAIVSRDTPYRKDVQIKSKRAHLYAKADVEYGSMLTLPYGVHLQQIKEVDARWVQVILPTGGIAYIQKGDLEETFSSLDLFAKQFIGLPYTWGGRSSFGFDCSGFVQMLYKKFSVSLPRDAKEQILDPRLQEIAIEELSMGDLLFWGHGQEAICHVALALSKEEFIHASSAENKPYLRISKLSDFEWSAAKGARYSYRVAKRLI